MRCASASAILCANPRRPFYLQETQASAAESGVDLRHRLSQVVGEMGQIDWLVPPMLQKA